MTWLLVIICVGLILSVASKYISKLRRRNMLNKWTDKSKGKLILHGMFGNNDFLPTVSPFVLKLETFLRFANIPYEIDKTDMWGPKGKTPWISFNGNHMGDSQLIIEFLKTKFDCPKNEFGEKEKAFGTMARVMIEEHLYWCGVMWRFAFGGKDTFQDVREGKKSFAQWMIFSMIASSMKSMAWSQGIGRHSESEMIELMMINLRALSNVLGNNKFFLGDQPSEDDFSIFGGLASAVFVPNSPVKRELDGEFRNLKEYCLRMREKFWPDWETVIAKNKE